MPSRHHFAQMEAVAEPVLDVRSYAMANATIGYKQRGTWDRYPILLSNDPMFGPDLLDTMTDRAVGACEDAVEDPQKRDRFSIERFSLLGWFGALADTVIGGLIMAALAQRLGGVG